MVMAGGGRFHGAKLARDRMVLAIARCQCFVYFDYQECRDYCPCSFQLPTAQGLVSNRFIVHASAAARRASKTIRGYRRVQSTGAFDHASLDNADWDLIT